MKVYVVEGRTGEYSDRREWPIAAYRTETAAKQHVTAAHDEAKTLGIGWDDDRYTGRIGSFETVWSGTISVDYTGVDYSYYEITLLEKPEEYLDS